MTVKQLLLFFNANQKCNEINENAITSPHYPNGYSKNTACDRDISLPNISAILLTRSVLNIEHNFGEEYGYYCTSVITINGRVITPESDHCDGTLNKTEPLCTIYYKSTDISCVNSTSELIGICNHTEEMQSGTSYLSFRFQARKLGGTWPNDQKFKYTYTLIDCNRNWSIPLYTEATTVTSSPQHYSTISQTTNPSTPSNITTYAQNTLSAGTTFFHDLSSKDTNTSEEDNTLKYILGSSIGFVVLLVAFILIRWKCYQRAPERSLTQPTASDEDGGVAMKTHEDEKERTEVINEIYDTKYVDENGIDSPEAVYATSSKIKSVNKKRNKNETNNGKEEFSKQHQDLKNELHETRRKKSTTLQTNTSLRKL